MAQPHSPVSGESTRFSARRNAFYAAGSPRTPNATTTTSGSAQKSRLLLGDVIGGIETHDAADIAKDGDRDEEQRKQAGPAHGYPSVNGTRLQISVAHHYDSLVYQYTKRSADQETDERHNHVKASEQQQHIGPAGTVDLADCNFLAAGPDAEKQCAVYTHYTDYQADRREQEIVKAVDKKAIPWGTVLPEAMIGISPDEKL